MSDDVFEACSPIDFHPELSGRTYDGIYNPEWKVILLTGSKECYTLTAGLFRV